MTPNEQHAADVAVALAYVEQFVREGCPSRPGTRLPLDQISARARLLIPEEWSVEATLGNPVTAVYAISPTMMEICGQSGWMRWQETITRPVLHEALSHLPLLLFERGASHSEGTSPLGPFEIWCFPTPLPAGVEFTCLLSRPGEWHPGMVADGLVKAGFGGVQ